MAMPDRDRSLVPNTADERRATSLSFGDIESVVYQALIDHLGKDAEGSDGYIDIYIRDLATDWVVWNCYGDSLPGPGLWKLSYSLDDDGETVTFSGNPASVVDQTSYVPTADPTSRSAPTAQDAGIAQAIDAASAAVSTAQNEQAKDPDLATDPDDAEIEKLLETAAAALKTAVTLQAKDGAADPAPDHPEVAPAANSVVDEAARSRRAKKPRHRSGLAPAPEFRHFAADGLEIRAAAGGNTNEIVISGAPIVYNAPYSVRDMFGEFQETMLPSVCRSVMASTPDVRFLFNHDGMPLARTTSGTLTLEDTDDALRFSCTLDLRQQLSNDLAVAIERGDITQMSCGFVVADDTWSDDYNERSIASFAQLFDVSAVTYPASPTTSIEIAQRMMTAMPIESRSRVRQMYNVAVDLRAGKVLSKANATQLTSALEALHAVDTDTLADSVRSHADNVTTAKAGIQSVLDATTGGTDGTAGGSGSNDDVTPTDGTARSSSLALEAELLRLRSSR